MRIRRKFNLFSVQSCKKDISPLFRYEIVYGKVATDEKTDDDFDDEEEKSKKNLKSYKLKDNFGTIRERSSPAILKYYIGKPSKKIREERGREGSTVQPNYLSKL